MNLLIVNDEKRTAELLRQEIDWKQYGIDEVHTAYDAESGKECMLAHTVSILLCDIEMPGESGLALLGWVRKNRLDIECIFLTCHADFMYAQEAISLGCQDYILMPARYEKIGEAVFKVVKRLEEKRNNGRYQEYGKAYLKEKLEGADKRSEKKISAEELPEEVKLYITTHLSDQDMSVNSIAEHFFFHPVYMNRVFKQKEGISVSQYIINSRMDLAGTLLDMGEISGNDLAEKVGYAYYTNFCNMFKRYYSCTPSQYQERRNHSSEKEGIL